MTELVVTTPDQLAQHIRQAVQHALDTYRPAQQPWMDTDQAAQYLGVSVSHLYTLCQSGQVPYGVVGRSRRFRAADLDAWLTERVG